MTAAIGKFSCARPEINEEAWRTTAESQSAQKQMMVERDSHRMHRYPLFFQDRHDLSLKYCRR
jgi:hypothetical protein